MSPVAPRLLILSRSLLLGTGYDEGDAGAEELETLRWMTTMTHTDLARAYESVLGDLPVRQAGNSYSRIVRGKRVPPCVRGRG